VICAELYLPEAIFSCKERMLSSSNSKTGISSGDIVDSVFVEELELQDVANKEPNPAVANAPVVIKSLLFM
jgi:hypothetical protein